MATLVTPSNVSYRVRVLRVRQVDQTNGFRRKVAALGANAAAVDPDLRSGTKAIANADPDGGKLMFPPVGSGKAFRSSRTGLAAFVTSTIAKAILSALRRNRYPFSPRVVGVSVSPAFLEDPGAGDVDLLLGMLRAARLSRKNTRERKNEGKQGCQKD